MYIHPLRLLALAWLALQLSASGLCQIYVAPAGNDSHNGSSAQPVRTLARAVALARAAMEKNAADVTVYLAGGVHRLSAPLVLTPEDSGIGGHKLIFTAAPGQHPVLSGAVRITGWKRVENAKNIWSAPVPKPVTDARQLYIDGIRATRTRGRLPVSLTKTSTGYAAADATLASWKEPSRIEFVYTGGNSVWSEKEAGIGSWTEPRCPVARIVGTEITMAQPCWNNSTERVMLPNGSRTANLVGPKSVGSIPSYIENAYELLGTPGQFYLDPAAATLYYVPRATEDLTKADVELPIIETLVELRGTIDRPVHDIVFSGLQFSYATWLGPNGPDGFSEIQAGYQVTGPEGYSKQALCSLVPGGTCPYAAWTKEPANVQLHYAHHVTFTRDAFVHLGAAGLDLGEGSQNNIVEGSVFNDISGNGLELASVDAPLAADEAFASDNRIDSNLFENVGAEYRGGIGIVVGYARRTLITHNRIDHVPYAAISIGWGGWPDKIQMAGQANRSAHNVISSNLIHDFMLVLSDGGGIYTQGRTGQTLTDGELVSNNVIYNQFSTGHAIYTDNGSSMITIKSNVIFQTNFDNWGSRHRNWYDGNNGKSDDPLLVENNYWQQGDADSAKEDVVVKGNHLINSLSQAPADLLQEAGLQPEFRDIEKLEFARAFVPDAPSRVAAWAANGEAYVTWSPSIRQGAAPVDSYLVRASNGAQATITSADFAHYSYVKLTALPAAPLTFTVSAVSRQGTSVESLPSLPVTPQAQELSVPPAPQNVSVHPGPGAVSIHFQMPPEEAWGRGKNPVIAYAVTIEPDHRKVLFTGRRIVVLEGRHATFDVVDGLTSGHSYTFKVATVSVAGEGAPTIVGPVTIP